jgi:hypothetical protein
MEIKFGDIVLDDWKRNKYLTSSYRLRNGVGSYVIIYRLENGHYKTHFRYEFEIMRDVFGDQSFASEDEAKQHVDDFLIRMSKLRAFI